MTNEGTGLAIVSTAKYFHIAFYIAASAMQDQHNQLTVVTRELIALKRGLNCVEFNMDNISEQDAYDYRTELDWQLGDNWKWPGNEAKSLPPVHSIFPSETPRS